MATITLLAGITQSLITCSHTTLVAPITMRVMVLMTVDTTLMEALT
jgi:hypothetical protein